MSAEQKKSIPYKELAAGAIVTTGIVLAGREILRRPRGQQKHLSETTPEPSLKSEPGQFATPGATERLPEANNVTQELPTLEITQFTDQFTEEILQGIRQFREN